MKHTVTMLKTLDGVDEGQIYPSTYREGEEYQIGDELLRCFVGLGGVKLVTESAEPEHRETKVTGPTETKPAKPLKKMSKAELVAHALDAYGLELAPDNLTANQMIEAIERAEAKAAE